MTDSTIQVPLLLGDLSAAGWQVQRSGIRWLCEDGRVCRAGEVLAYCNVGLCAVPGYLPSHVPFQGERRDFQVALVAPLAGRLVHAAGVSQGGFLDLLGRYQIWTPTTTIGWLECPAEGVFGNPEVAGRLKMLLATGRRTIEHAEVRGGLLTGWHERARAWWGNGPRFGNVLSLGICEQVGIIRGEQLAFLEFFEAAPGPAHVAFVPDDIIVPSLAVLTAQLRLTQSERDRIVADAFSWFASAVAAGGGWNPVVADWIYAGCLLKAFCGCPLLEHSEVLTASGLQKLGPADSVILSLNSELALHFRHKRLGYPLSLHQFRLQGVGPLVRQWLHQEFEVVKKLPDDVRREYLELIDLVRARTGACLLVLNTVSTSMIDCFCYAPFDRPLGGSLVHIRAQEMNLMLYDLARERDISIIDIDALAVELGKVKHIADGVHASGLLQERFALGDTASLRDRGIAGF